MERMSRETYYNTLTESILEHYYKEGSSLSPVSVKSILKAVDECVPILLKDTPFTSDDLLAIAALETGFDMKLVGKHGEKGVFQILHANEILREMGMPLANSLEPKVNTQMACYILKGKYQSYPEYKKAIIAYNGVRKDGNERYWKLFRDAKDLIRDLKAKAKEI